VNKFVIILKFSGLKENDPVFKNVRLPQAEECA